MDENSQSRVGPFGRYIIFAGTGMVFMAVCTFMFKPLARVSGEKLLPYVILGLGMASIFGTLFFYDRCPKRLIIPIGLVGWLLTFLLLLLHNWF
jgi:tryptophan-rich sensory protein